MSTESRTPIERAAEAVHYALGRDDYGVANEDERKEVEDIARAVFESIDREWIIRAVRQADDACEPGGPGYASPQQVADAIIAHLTTSGGAS